MPPEPRLPGGAAAELTITELAAATGITQATLRAWESRHGVPAPQRLVNGHRRYPARDAKLLAAAVDHRRQGLSVSAALARARADLAQREPSASIFAALREIREDLVPQPVAQPVLADISRAIEDECLTRATRGLLIGGFERAAYYRRSERRWRELAASMTVTIVFADFPTRRERLRGPSEIPIADSSPMSSEWVLIAPTGCLLARERAPSNQHSRTRLFDTIWSPEPEVVHAAARSAIGLLGDGPVSRRALQALGPAPAPSSPELRRAAALTNRIIGYVA